jgi:hypothetical protein
MPDDTVPGRFDQRGGNLCVLGAKKRAQYIRRPIFGSKESDIALGVAIQRFE